MKKYIIIVLLFTFPLIGYAQTAQEMYISSLQQLITLLTKEVSALEQQLQNLSPISQTQVTNPIESVFGNTNLAPITIEIGGNDNATTSVDILGNNCQAFDEIVRIKYNNGTLQKEPFTYITSNGNSHNNLNGFVYRAQKNNGTDIVLVNADGLQKELDFNIIPYDGLNPELCNVGNNITGNI